MMYIDIGGTYLRIAVFKNNKFKIIKKIPHNKRRKKEFKRNLEKVINNSNVKGVSYAGIILKESKNEKIIYLPNVHITLKLKKNIVSENDANLIALSHRKKNKVILSLVVGTGIGIGVWYRDRLLDKNFGEIGHINFNGKELEKLVLQKIKKKGFENLDKKEKERFFSTIATLIENLFLIFFFDELVLHGSLGKIIYQNKDTKFLKRCLKNIREKFNKSIKVTLSDETDVFKGLRILEELKK